MEIQTVRRSPEPPRYLWAMMGVLFPTLSRDLLVMENEEGEGEEEG